MFNLEDAKGKLKYRLWQLHLLDSSNYDSSTRALARKQAAMWVGEFEYLKELSEHEHKLKDIINLLKKKDE